MKDPVGRTWYVKITEGMVGYHAELGTHHLEHGLQVWDRIQESAVMQSRTEREIIDELWYCLSRFQERRA